MKNICAKIALLTLIATTSHAVFDVNFTKNWGMQFKNPKEVLEYVKQFLPYAPIIVEAGAHHGDDTVNMKSVWPYATMHLFEPLPQSFKIMRKNLINIPQVHFYPLALSNHEGITEFHVNFANTGACSINGPVHWNAAEFEKTPTQIHCSTLDTWAHLYDISHVDFMWLDMEGHELYALQGAKKLLYSVKAIYTEVSYIPVRVNSGNYKDVTVLLEEYGFTEVWRWDVGNGYGDALFIKKDLLNQDPSHPQANSQH